MRFQTLVFIGLLFFSGGFAVSNIGFDWFIGFAVGFESFAHGLPVMHHIVCCVVASLLESQVLAWPIQAQRLAFLGAARRATRAARRAPPERSREPTERENIRMLTQRPPTIET